MSLFLLSATYSSITLSFRYFDEPKNSSAQPRWPSPAYKGLIGNVLPEFLSFSQYPFPPSAANGQPFPTLTETHEYLRSFARPYLSSGVIRLNTEVVRLEELIRRGQNGATTLKLCYGSLSQDERIRRHSHNR